MTTAQKRQRLERTLKKNPGDLNAWLSLIELHLHQNQVPAALDAVERAIAATGGSAGLRQLRQTLQAATPEPWVAELAQLTAHLDAGELDVALPLAEAFTQHWPEHSEGWSRLAEIHHRRQARQEAIEAARQAVALKPDSAPLLANLGAMLNAAGEYEQAKSSLRQALEIDPNCAAAHANLGPTLRACGDLSAAEASCRRALELNPRQAEVHCNLGHVLRNLNQSEAAVAAYQRAIELDEHLVDAWYCLGVSQANLGWLEAAEHSYREALDRASTRVDLLNSLGELLGSLDQFAPAAELFEQALIQDPDNPRLLTKLAHALKGLGALERAEATYRRVMALQPEDLDVRTALVNLQIRQKQYTEALETLAEMLRIDPKSAPAHWAYARILMEIGASEESGAAYRQALPLNTHVATFRSDMLVAMAFTCYWPAPRMREVAEEWETAVLSETERAEARARVFSPAPRAGRKLRLGLLSAELGQHPVGYFLRPWLEALDRDRFEVFMYPTRNRNDAKTPLFQVLADHWGSLAGLNDRQAAARIRQDRIDILIDTSGHDADGRPGVIAHRAAPLQCHYIGYFATTGLSQMDYFIGDAVLIPPEHDAHFTETVWRLPRTRYAYAPLEEAPEPRWWPDPDGQLWVGSFNNLVKVREASLALWARVLHALPEARLALKDNKGANHNTQARILQTLQTHGIPSERVAFMAKVPSWAEHMAYYNRLDVALDSVPFNSATTGFDALWMGCPLVTLAGDQLAGRQAASLLTGLGRPEWIARSEEDYVRLAVDLARDRSGRQQIRATQREQMRASELCDGSGLARALEAAFETLYARWWQQRNATD